MIGVFEHLICVCHVYNLVAHIKRVHDAMLCDVMGLIAAVYQNQASREVADRMINFIELARDPLFYGTGTPFFLGRDPIFVGMNPIFVGRDPTFVGMRPRFCGTKTPFLWDGDPTFISDSFSPPHLYSRRGSRVAHCVML